MKGCAAEARKGAIGPGAGRASWRGLLLACAVLLAGCAGERPIFLPPEPPQRPAGLGRPLNAIEQAAQREHQRLLSAFGGEYRAPAVKRVVEEIVGKLAAATAGQGPASYEVTLLNSPVVNAFALPNGRIYVTRGLVALANDRSEAASVIAHEIAHVIARHAVERAELQQRSELVGRVVSQVLGDPVAGAAVQVQSRVTIASFSRQQELEADLIAVKAIAAAGFDPYGASRFLASLQRTTGQRAMLTGERGPRGLDILSTHPSTAERIQLTLASARQIAAPGLGLSDRDGWLSALDGITFGDDPSEGAVRGRRYLNPSLGLSFTAPEGLALESTRDAVLGVGGNGARAMRFDSVQLEPGQSLESYVAAGWIEGVRPGPVEQITVGGMPGALSSGRGADWSFRLAAIQKEQRTYRFIFASRGGVDAELDQAFRAAVNSFRRLSPDEARAIRPMRLQLVTAQSGDTAASLASRMASEERALEQFMILNGLERGGQVVPGRRYKIIVE